MRLWHKDLIPVLPRQQLLGQWRELCLIAKGIAEDGTPNHLLVNKVIEYPPEHLYTFAQLVFSEMMYRGYNCDFYKFSKWYKQIENNKEFVIRTQDVFKKWHNDRYYKQCFYNLQEKFDCGGIPVNEYNELLRNRSNRK